MSELEKPFLGVKVMYVLTYTEKGERKYFTTLYPEHHRAELDRVMADPIKYSDVYAGTVAECRLDWSK